MFSIQSVTKRFLMRKIVTIICFALSVLCGDLWGGVEYPVGSFVGISESTRNLFAGYVRCGSLVKSLVPTSETPILTAIKAIGAYSMDIAAKAKEVKFFLDSLVGSLGEAFSAECRVANPTLNLSPEKSCEILVLLRKDLETWLEKHRIFLEK